MWKSKVTTAEEAVRVVKSGDRVFIHGSAATPLHLIRALTDRAPELRGVEIVAMHTEGPAPYADPGMEESFRANVFFVGGNIRKAVQEGRADYIPVFLSEVPLLFRRGVMPLDVAIVTVSPPDQHGYCTLGTSVDVARAAVETAKYVIAQANPNMPRTHGEGMIHVKEIDALVEVNDPLPEHAPPQLGEKELAIGRHIAELVEDGATLQLGIGGIPDATLAALRNHKRLGIHSEMISDGVIDLVESGVITGEEKRIRPGKVVVGFINGSRRLYDFVHDNPLLSMAEMSFVNDTATIRQNPKVTAINSAIEVDFTGQVVADSIGERHYSGIGGQMDFIRGAGLSQGGKPIIALPSVTRRGETRIVPYIKQGAGVVTTRGHVHYIVTEQGVAYLYGKNLRERARAMIAIAHPDHREALEREAHRRFGRI